MIKQVLYIGFFLFLIGTCKAQPSKNVFVLNGSANIDSGVVMLLPMDETGYYEKLSIFNERIIQNGKFSIQDTLSYPAMFRIGIKIKSKLEYISDYFFIDTGSQNITCNVDSLREIPNIENKPMKEYLVCYAGYFKNLNDSFASQYRLHDSLRRSYQGKIPNYYQTAYENSIDSLRQLRKRINFKYSCANPGSYVVLWEIIYESKNGYQPILDTIFHSLDQTVKSSFTGLILNERLHSMQVLSIGSVFPSFEVLDTAMSLKKFDVLKTKSKYFFIDFWFSHCQPCLHEFPELKRLTSEYRDTIFSIIGISTDNSMFLGDWRKEIIKLNANWIQVLDLNGVWSAKYSIHAFPTNFLLDDKGIILKRDIMLPQLIDFLEKNANK